MSDTIGELIKRGEVLSRTLREVRPPIDTSPQMVKTTESNMRLCFKSKTESKYKKQAREINEYIRNNY